MSLHPLRPGAFPQSLRDALTAAGVPVASDCGGVGACGRCRVQVVAGEMPPPSPADLRCLGPDACADGVRLACQTPLRSELWVAVDPPAQAPAAPIPDADLPAPAGVPPHVSGMAVDLGTSHLRMSWWEGGQRRGTWVAPNPQGPWGADVLNRLEAARRDPRQARALSEVVGRALAGAWSAAGHPGPAPGGALALVGNTAMLALATGAGIPALLDPEAWERPVSVLPEDPGAWMAAWGLPGRPLQLPAPLGGFVGSDLLAALLATDLAGGPGPALLLDVGTNTEMALWDGHRLWASAVPGGPAFEGMGLRHGRPVGPGAITRVRRDDAGHPTCEVLGGGPPLGFCGSGLVDAVALLLASGALRSSGRFSQGTGPEGYRLDPAEPCTALTGADVDALQRAKAAVASGLEALLSLAGLRPGDLRRICLCGAFGRHLGLDSAQRLGLLPALPAATFERHPQAALAGAERLLLAPEAPDLCRALAARTTLVNQVCLPGWEDRYIRHLRLHPMAPGAESGRQP